MGRARLLLLVFAQELHFDFRLAEYTTKSGNQLFKSME